MKSLVTKLLGLMKVLVTKLLGLIKVWAIKLADPIIRADTEDRDNARNWLLAVLVVGLLPVYGGAILLGLRGEDIPISR